MNSYINEILSSKIATYTSTSTQSTNSQRKHIREIFNLILTENLKNTNEFGYSEISSLRLKKIDKRHYKELLTWLENEELINIRKSYSGKESYAGKFCYYREENGKYISTSEVKQEPFCKGYKVNEDLLENSRILYGTSQINYSQLLIDFKKKSIEKPIINQSLLTPSHSIIKGGNTSPERTDWNLTNCWNQLTLAESTPLSSAIIKKYEDGLKKTYAFKDGRFFGQFHFIKKDHIQYLNLFNEKIQEWGDGTAFFTKLIGKLIEDLDYIPYQEKFDFQKFAINDPYVFLMKKLYLNTREEAKSLLNAYVNSINQTAAKMRNIDEFFKSTFPNIRSWLRSIPTIKVKDESGRTKKKKQLWKLNQNMEAKIMTKLASDLNKRYGVFPLTKHDAIYFNSSDIEKLNENNVIFSTEIKKSLDYQYYNDLIFEI